MSIKQYLSMTDQRYHITSRQIWLQCVTVNHVSNFKNISPNNCKIFTLHFPIVCVMMWRECLYFPVTWYGNIPSRPQSGGGLGVWCWQWLVGLEAPPSPAAAVTLCIVRTTRGGTCEMRLCDSEENRRKLAWLVPGYILLAWFFCVVFQVFSTASIHSSPCHPPPKHPTNHSQPLGLTSVPGHGNNNDYNDESLYEIINLQDDPQVRVRTQL